MDQPRPTTTRGSGGAVARVSTYYGRVAAEVVARIWRHKAISSSLFAALYLLVGVVILSPFSREEWTIRVVADNLTALLVSGVGVLIVIPLATAVAVPADLDANLRERVKSLQQQIGEDPKLAIAKERLRQLLICVNKVLCDWGTETTNRAGEVTNRAYDAFGVLKPELHDEAVQMFSKVPRKADSFGSSFEFVGEPDALRLYREFVAQILSTLTLEDLNVEWRFDQAR